jgi:hypothetical protein
MAQQYLANQLKNILLIVDGLFALILLGMNRRDLRIQLINA